MSKVILAVATAIFLVVAAFAFWKLANKYGARLSLKRLILILMGLAFIYLAICCL